MPRYRAWRLSIAVVVVLHISHYYNGHSFNITRKALGWRVRDVVPRQLDHRLQSRAHSTSSHVPEPVGYFYVPSNKTIMVTAPRYYIPAVIIPVLWEVDLLPRNIWSIDVPVKQIIVVVNHLKLSSRFDAENTALSHMRNVTARLVRDIPARALDVIFLGENHGFARSMNLGMRKVQEWAPWWLCVNADISYPPGALMSIIPFIWDDHLNGTVLYMLGHGFSAIVFTRHLVSRVGLFDEHIWPAYVEDCDLMLRVRLSVGDVNIDDSNGGEKGKYHNLHPIPAFQHTGGQGSSSNAGFGFASKIQKAHANNIAYYMKKWGISAAHWHNGKGVHKHGCGVPMINQYITPFNVSGEEDWETLPYVAEHDRRQKEIFASQL